jgi:hypothetical protein
VKLPDFSEFEPLNKLKDQMGIPRDHYGSFAQAGQESIAPDSRPARAFILLKSGGRLDLLDPNSNAWSHEDLAIGLSRTYRWGGYSKWDLPLSVAQHSLAVLALRETQGPLSAHEALRELLHDATEGLLGFDPITSIKPYLGEPFAALDRRLQAAIDQRYRLPPWDRDSYATHKHADRLAAASEAYHVAGWALEDMRETLGIALDPLDNDPLTLPPGMKPWEPWPPKLAEAQFFRRLIELLESAERDATPPDQAAAFSRQPEKIKQRSNPSAEPARANGGNRHAEIL